MDLDELRAFLAVAEAGSFSGASKASNIVRSTLARRVEALERRLGVRLLISTEQGIELTTRGRRLAEEGPRVLAEARAVEAAISDRSAELTSTIRCVLPLGVHHFGTAGISARVNARFPRITWHFEIQHSPMETLAAGKADLALHWGKSVPEGPWLATRLHELPVGLLASDEYLTRRGMPKSLDDLAGHDLLTWFGADLPNGELPLRSGETLAIVPKAVCHDLLVLYEMARQGNGIALMPIATLPMDPWAHDHAARVLPDLVGTELTIWLVVPRALAHTEAVQVMIEESLSFMQQLNAVSSR